MRYKYKIGITKSLHASTQVQKNGANENLVIALGVAKNQYRLYDVHWHQKTQSQPILPPPYF